VISSVAAATNGGSVRLIEHSFPLWRWQIGVRTADRILVSHLDDAVGMTAAEPFPMQYRIRIRGHLDPTWTAWFDELTLTQKDDGNG
jgi:hypothetical protein